MDKAKIADMVDALRGALGPLGDAPLSVLVGMVGHMRDNPADADDWVDFLIVAAIESELRARRIMGDDKPLYDAALSKIAHMVQTF